MQHIITSGCSFSEATGTHNWPGILQQRINIPMSNYGASSAGNSWIAKTAIHGARQVMNSGVAPDKIMVIVMWSGIDRKDLFISRKDTPGYSNLICTGKDAPNPINFLDNFLKASTVDGYLLGSMSAEFGNMNVKEVKKELIMPFFSDEALAIESYENFLRLQWFCAAYGITLFNLTFMDIMHYPEPWHVETKEMLTKDRYRNILPLYEMLNFDNWLFWKSTMGMYEYTKDNALPFAPDLQHPDPPAHIHFVENFLLIHIKDF